MPFNYFSCLLICLLSPLVLSLPRLIIPNESNDYSLSTPEPSLFTSRILASQSQSGSTSEAVDTLTLHGSSLFGYYFTTLYFGTPAQKQTLIVDTGSTITTIPCNECGHNCGVAHFNDFYTPEKSTSHQSMECQESIGNYQCRNCNDGCRFSISYSEGSSYSGQFKKDYVSFEHSSKTALELVNDAAASKNSPSKPQSFRGLDSSQESWMTDSGIAANDVTPNTPESRLFLPFGCTLQETNLFLTQEVDGILGLGILTNTDRNPPNLMDTISMKNSSISNAFSICFGQQGGYLALGGFNKTYHSKQDTVKYVPYDGQGGQYRVHWKNVKFQGKTLNIQESTLNRGKGAYIDSGTTLFYAPQDIADVIKGSLTEYCGQNSANCGGGAAKEGMCWMYDKKKYSNLQQFFATFGSFSLEFGQENSVEYEWKPEDYLFRIAGEKPFYCFGLDSIPPLPNERGVRTIFGGTFMKNHDILFDKSNKRIGFVRSDCTAEYNIATFPPSKHKDPLNKPNYFIVAILLVILLLLVSWLVAYYINQRNKMHGDIKIIPHLELGISPTRKSSSSSGSMESSSDLRLLSDGSSGSSLQELEEHFAV